MKLSVSLGRFDQSRDPAALGARLAELAVRVEEVGVATFAVVDHWLQIPTAGRPTAPMLEGYTALAFVAAHTSSIRLRQNVSAVTFRHPAHLAKLVATLDVLSGGRADLGIGAGWYEREHVALGLPFPPIEERARRLEESIRICRQMWDEDQDGPFEGRHYRLAATVCSPPPLSRPEIVVGGSGRRHILPVMARHADAGNLVVGSEDQLVDALQALDDACRQADRDPETLRRTVTYDGDVVARTDDFLRLVRRGGALGVDEALVLVPRTLERFVDRCALLVPRLTEIGQQHEI